MVALQRLSMHRVILLATIVTAACSSASTSSDLGRYDLACDTIDMDGASVWKCAKIDTRKGVVTLVDLDHVPTTDGLGFAKPAEVGHYQLRCNSTAVPREGEFRCVRLDTQTGVIQYVKLP